MLSYTLTYYLLLAECGRDMNRTKLPEEKRTRNLSALFTESERAMITAAAQRAHMTDSSWARWVLTRAAQPKQATA
jgi:hypothetical protein